MEDEGEMLDPKDDATTWRLERLPMTACHAERDAARPSYARTTAPLTERFADRNRVCHARTYDADHLAGHPNQTVVSMTLMTEDRVRGNDEGGRITTFVPVRLSVTLRDGTVATRSARCDAVDYELGCSGEGGGFTLVRSGERGLEVRDLNRKRTDGPDNWLAKFLRAPLGDDDRVFRLDEASDPTCGPASPR